MDSLDGSITVNQVFCAKYAPISSFLLKNRKKKREKKNTPYLTERSQERYSWINGNQVEHTYIFCAL